MNEEEERDNSFAVDDVAATILVVDDVEDNRRLLARFLKKKGHNIMLSSGGSDALRQVENELPDLVLLDITMPDIDGLSVLRRLRANYSPVELPVIMVTALDDPESIVKSLNSGANDYVTKPIDFPVLTARCSSQLQRRAAAAALRNLNEELEQRVEIRTAELRRAYDVLKDESAERRRAQSLTKKREEMYRALYDDNPTTFLTISEDLAVLSVNRFGADKLGYEVEDLVGEDLGRVYVEADHDLVKAAIVDCLVDAGTPKSWEARMLCRDGSVVWTRATGRSRFTAEGPKNVLVVCEDITEARRLSEQLSYEARHDALTGLYNRSALELRLQHALDSLQDNDDAHQTFCYIDLDQFKLINDSCGLVGGDELLRQLAGVLSEAIGGTDTIARLGGDEFGVLLDKCPADVAQGFATQICEAISKFRFIWDGKTFTTSASIGVVTIDTAFRDASQIMLAADSSCYAAKDAGRNRVHAFEASDTSLIQRHGEMRWVIKVKRALETDNFQLYAQPIVPLRNQRSGYLHYEVLLRLIDDDGSAVPPGAFLPAAERYNFSSSVDRWVVRSTLSWLAQRSDYIEPLSICAINLSGQSLGDELLMNELLALMSAYPVAANKLCFEVTETAAITNLSVAIKFINKLKLHGCCFALDDFGSGLSSFAYLNNLPVDYVKIDGVFIKDIVENPVNEAIVVSINEVAHVMGKKTIAEFVENDAIARKLREIGVDYAQGYGIGKPAPIAEMYT